jgi:hypothetical protein
MPEQMDFENIFKRMAYGLIVDWGEDQTLGAGRKFWKATGQYGNIYYSNRAQMIWGQDSRVVQPSTAPAILPTHANNLRLNNEGVTSVRVEPGYVAEFLPRWERVPEVWETFSPLWQSNQRETHRFNLSIDDVVTLFRSTYTESGVSVILPREGAESILHET